MPNIRTRLRTFCLQMIQSCGLRNMTDTRAVLTEEFGRSDMAAELERPCFQELLDDTQTEESIRGICNCSAVHTVSDSSQGLIGQISSNDSRCYKVDQYKMDCDCVSNNTCDCFNMEPKRGRRGILERILSKFRQRDHSLIPGCEKMSSRSRSSSATQRSNTNFDTPVSHRSRSNSRGDSSHASQPAIQNIYRKPLSRLSAHQAPPTSAIVLCPISELASKSRTYYNAPPYCGRRQWDSEPNDVCNQGAMQPLTNVDITTSPAQTSDEQFRRRVFTMPSMRNNLFSRQMDESSHE